MKRLTTLLLSIVFSLAALGQTPEGVNYQAVARNGSGDVLSNQSLTVRTTIKESGPAGTTVYQESHNVATNDFGLFSLTIGQGTVISGAFGTIDWGTNSFFLQVEIDDGSGFVNLGTNQFVSVPYALYAKEAGNAGTSYNAGTGINISGNTIENTGDTNPADDITNTTNAGGDVSGTFSNLSVKGLQGRAVSATAPNPGEVLEWNGSAWAPATDNTGGGSYTAGSGISISSNTITNTAPDQTVNISGSGATNVSGSYPNFTISSTDNDNQNLSLSGNNLSISGGNSVTLPSGGSSLWNQSGSDINYTAGKVYVGRSSGITSNEVFGISGQVSAHTYTGMYIEGSDPASKPFYGYATNGNDEMWTYYDGANDKWSVYNNGDLLTVDGNGNVGVGLNDPDEALVINDNSDAYVVARNISGSGNTGFVLSQQAGQYYAGMSMDVSTDDLRLYNNNFGGNITFVNSTGTERMRIESGGNVGIGTDDPMNRLHVEGGKALIGEHNGVISKLTVNSTTSGEDIFRARKNGITQFLIDDDGNAKFHGDSVLFDMDINDDLVMRQDGSESQIVVYGNFNTNGQIGSSGLPFYRVYSSAFYASSSGSYLTYSDSRIKENVKTLDNPVKKISQLKGVSYDLTQEHFTRNGGPRDESERLNQLGLIAQDVEKVFPQLVKTNKETGLKTVGYMGLIPVLVEGIKEQQTQIETLQKENQTLKNKYKALEQRLSDLESH